MRYRGRPKLDANHTLIVQAFEAHGWFVDQQHALGGGHPDLCVWRPLGGARPACGAYVEVKASAAEAKRKTATAKRQAAWAARARAHGIKVVTVTSVEDVQRFVWGKTEAR